jgi:hypothetical protein
MVEPQGSEPTTEGSTMPRYEIPAVIVVDVENEDALAALQRSDTLTVTLGQESGPGAFFYGISAVATGEPPRLCEEDREAETVAKHSASLMEARGV